MTMRKKQKIDNIIRLREYEIFSGLSEDQIDKFCKALKPIQFDKGDIILQEGEVGNSILLLLDGKVEITLALTLQTSHSQIDTREKSLIELSGDNHPFFGEMSLFSDDDKRTATVKAVSTCLIGRLDKKDFFEICNTHPEIGNKVMQNISRVLCKRLKQANQNVLKLTTAFNLMVET